MRVRLRLVSVLAALTAALFSPRSTVACSCREFVGLVERARQAPLVVEARVLSHHPAPADGWAASIVVKVVASFKGSLTGQVRLYGSGLGDCTVSATSFGVGETFLFVLFDQFKQPLEGKPGYGLYGVCGAVSARLRDGIVEGVLHSTRRDEKRTVTTMPLVAFRHEIGEPRGQKGLHP